jgi:hypothetical protein
MCRVFASAHDDMRGREAAAAGAEVLRHGTIGGKEALGVSWRPETLHALEERVGPGLAQAEIKVAAAMERIKGICIGAFFG